MPTDPRKTTTDTPDRIVIWERLLRFQRKAVREMDRSLRAHFDRSLDDYDVMHQVARNGAPIRMGDLSDRLLVAHSSCTRIVGRLVDSGHLRRRPGQVDRREIFVELTPAGRKLQRRMAALHTRDIEQLIGATFTAEAARVLDATLATID